MILDCGDGRPGYIGRDHWRMAVDQSRTFAVVLEPEDEGGFTVRVPAFPEIVTYGKDEREALAMAEDAIRLVIADCAARV
jgi:antitoxin HicB